MRNKDKRKARKDRKAQQVFQSIVATHGTITPELLNNAAKMATKASKGS